VQQNGLFTLREVKVNSNFSVATVIYSVIGCDLGQTQEKLEKEAGKYRLQLAKRLNMRKTPQLSFVYDNEGLAADNMRRFLDAIVPETVNDDDATPAATPDNNRKQ